MMAQYSTEPIAENIPDFLYITVIGGLNRAKYRVREEAVNSRRPRKAQSCDFERQFQSYQHRNEAASCMQNTVQTLQLSTMKPRVRDRDPAIRNR